MNTLKTFVKKELSGWKTWEVIRLIAACSVITSVSIYLNDTVMGIISSTTGVACVVCAATA